MKSRTVLIATLVGCIGVFETVFPPALAQNAATNDKVGIAIVPKMTGGDKAEQQLYEAVGAMPEIKKVYTAEDGNDMLNKILALKKTGKQVNFLVLAGHGSRDTPGFKWGSDEMIPEDVSLEYQKGQLAIAKAIRAGPPNDKYTPEKLDKLIQEHTARIEQLEALSDVMAPDAVVLLINCSAAATGKGRDFVRSLGENLLGEKGGHIFASKTDINIKTKWVDGTHAEAGDLLVDAKWVKFNVMPNPIQKGSAAIGKKTPPQSEQPPSDEVIVPNLVGMRDWYDILESLSKAGLKFTRPISSAEKPPSGKELTVQSQSEPAGKKVKRGTPITVTFYQKLQDFDGSGDNQPTKPEETVKKDSSTTQGVPTAKDVAAFVGHWKGSAITLEDTEHPNFVRWHESQGYKQNYGRMEIINREHVAGQMGLSAKGVDTTNTSALDPLSSYFYTFEGGRLIGRNYRPQALGGKEPEPMDDYQTFVIESAGGQLIMTDTTVWNKPKRIVIKLLWTMDRE